MTSVVRTVCFLKRPPRFLESMRNHCVLMLCSSEKKQDTVRVIKCHSFVGLSCNALSSRYCDLMRSCDIFLNVSESFRCRYLHSSFLILSFSWTMALNWFQFHVWMSSCKWIRSKWWDDSTIVIHRSIRIMDGRTVDDVALNI